MASKMRILFNTVPFGVLGADGGSKWDESRVLCGSLTDAVSLHRHSGNNTGNFIHWEAPSRIIHYDAEKSRSIRLWSTITKTKEKEALREYLQKNYDAIVISEANFIQKATNLGIVADFLATLQGVELYLFGAGIQDSPPENFGDLTEGTANFIRLMNKKAALFATRGQQTTSALKSLGLMNSKPIGCPSLFAFPEQMLNIRRPLNITRICSAGHLTKKALEEKDIRALKVVELAQHVDVGYVFQTELFGYTGVRDKSGKFFSPNAQPGIYSEATSDLDPRYMKSYFKAVSGMDVEIRDYMYFGNCNSWRKRMQKFDVYIGDRFHGGVACMQAGLPSVFLKNDTRVDELTAAIAAPSIKVSDFEPSKYADIVSEVFSDINLKDYYQNYRQKYEIFKSTLEDSGLKVRNNL